MSNTASAIQVLPRRLPQIARSEHRTVLRALPLAPPVDDLYEDSFDEDTRGWIEAHLDKLLAFVGSAALAAALVCRLLPAGPHAAPVPALAPVRAEPVVIAATPAPADPVEIAVPPSVEEPAAVQPVVRAAPHVAKRAAKRVVHAAAKPHAKAHARHAPHVARSSAGGPFAAARQAYASGDLGTAEQTLRSASFRDAANRVATVARLVDEGQGALRVHDEAAAVRAFENAARADRAAALGSGKISHEIAQKLGLLHVAAALRDRRAGNDAGARREFEAAHRADPDNARATAELAAPADEIELRDAIDPE